MRRALVVLAVVVLAAAPAGCRRGHKSSSSQPSRSTGGTSGTSGQPSRLLASAAGEAPGVMVEVNDLRRSGGDVTLRFTLRNVGSRDYSVLTSLADPTVGLFEQQKRSDVGGVYLVDLSNRKKYLTEQDKSGRCVCTSELKAGGLKPGEALSLFATFPAPPASVKSITVVVPHFLPMDDVPIAG